MNDSKTNGPKTQSRRAFFLRSGAVLGTGVAVAGAMGPAVAMSPAVADARLDPHSPAEGPLRAQDRYGAAQDREAIRQLQRTFMASMESRDYEAVMSLFAVDAHLTLSDSRASGRAAIERLFTQTYRQQNGGAFHRAYRQTALHPAETITLSEDGMRASASFHTDTEVCTPLSADCTVAQMARLSGHVADHAWLATRFDVEYVKDGAQWRVASLRDQPAVAEQFGAVPQR